MRDSFIFYRSFYEALNDLDDQSQLRIYQAIAQYSLDFTEPELSGVESTIFKLIKPNLEANNKRYLNGKQPKKKQDGSKNEAKQEQTESKEKQDGSKEKQDGSKSVANKDKDKDKDIKKAQQWKDISEDKQTKLQEQFESHCIANTVSPLEKDKFINYCLANGKKYIDWKAAFRNWCANAKKWDKSDSVPNSAEKPSDDLIARMNGFA